jgi:uncharacterized protein (TIGR02466 family)
MALQIAPVFAVPLAQAFLPEPQALNAELKQLLLGREAEGGKYANATPSLKQQAGVFESDFELFSSPERCIQQLKAFCWTSLGEALRDINGYSAAEMQRIEIFSHTWFHVTRDGGFTVLHTHPMASWSGVYCVSPGASVADRPESGVLRFHNPHYYSNYFMDAGNARQQAPYHHGTWSIVLQPGQLVLFPSWLQHEVLPFYGHDERITIAFNCWFGMKPGTPR